MSTILTQVELKSFTYDKLQISWRHSKRHNKLYVKSVIGEYFFLVPSDWELKNWSLHYRRLAEVLIFQQFWESKDFAAFIANKWISDSLVKADVKADVKVEVAVTNNDKDKDKDKENLEESSNNTMNTDNNGVVAISFSGGLDSCAIVPLLEPGFFMAYLKRVIPMTTMMRHKQQLLALDYIHDNYECSSFIMETDIELISLKITGRVGFPSEYACCLPCIILADHVGITSICTGTIGLFIKGVKYHEFNKTTYFKFWKDLFQKANLELFWPVGGVVDRGTALICERTGIPGQSCIRNDDGFCNRCFKCFRKNILILNKTQDGSKSQDSINRYRNRNHSRERIRVLRIPPEAKHKLIKKPLTLIELYQKGVIKDYNLEKFKSLDLSYQSHYMKECYDYLVPQRLKKNICQRLDALLGEMNDKQINTVKKLDLSSLNDVKINLD